MGGMFQTCLTRTQNQVDPQKSVSQPRTPEGSTKTHFIPLIRPSEILKRSSRSVQGKTRCISEWRSNRLKNYVIICGIRNVRDSP